VSLHDRHLQTALRHAPDQDLAPSQRVRENVLKYAVNAVKPAPENWLNRSLSTLANWRVRAWQVAGMGVLASVLLVIVMLREQMSGEPVWVETDNKSVAQAEVAKSKAEVSAAANAPEAYQALPQVAERAAPMREEAKPSLEKRDLATQEAPAKELAETTQIAAAPALPKTAEKTSEMADAVETIQAPEATVVAAAPAPAPPAEVEAKQGLAKAKQASGSVTNEASMAQALNIETLLKQGGEATAKQDIAAGNLQILKLETEACEKPSKLEVLDADTNYKVQVICDLDDKARSEQLQREVDAYNQTMRSWQQKKSKIID